jgi:alpha-galactosidase
VKVAVVGAGSAQFLIELADFCALDGIGPYEVAMVDTDPQRLDVVGRLGSVVADTTGTPVTVTTHHDRAAALDGADAVVTSIGVGMQESIQPDFEIPARYGLRQTVADTMGIGAIIRILRTAPVLADIATDMMERCPDALLLNVTNPMTMCCMALHRMVPDITTIGLCHSTWMTAETVAGHLGIPVGELEYAGAGVNHQVFLSRLVHNGVDVYPQLRQLAETDGEFAATVRADLLRRTGYFVTESSKHNSEYVPWYLPWDDQVERFDLPVNPWESRRADNENWFGYAEKVADGTEPFPAGVLPSGEYAPQIVRSLVDAETRPIYANVPNHTPEGGRWVEELPEWAVVEVPATADGDGVHPRVAEAIPPQCAAINRRYLDVCDLAVRAVVEGRRDHVHHAALLDPNASATMTPDGISSMVDELLDVHQLTGRIPENLWR